MNPPYLRFVGALAALHFLAPPAMAGVDDYRLELISPAYPVGAGTTIELRLTDLRSGAPVEGAVIFATRMDMEPEGMEAMTSPVTLLPSEAPGLYRLATDLTMAGTWRLSVAAKLQGETGTVQAQLPFEAQP